MGNNVDLQKLAYVIKVKRQEKGFTTMEQIAEYIGYTRVYLSQILNGKIEITQDVKDKLMYKLNINLDKLDDEVGEIASTPVLDRLDNLEKKQTMILKELETTTLLIKVKMNEVDKLIAKVVEMTEKINNSQS